MFLTKGSEYGIKATIFIASKCMENNHTNLKEIAAAIDSPVAYTAKVLQKLVKGKIIDSIRGANGGFEISYENIEKISIFQIITSIDGDDIASNCLLGLNKCSSTNPCPIHHKYVGIRQNTISVLKETTLKELATKFDNNLSVLVN